MRERKGENFRFPGVGLASLWPCVSICASIGILGLRKQTASTLKVRFYLSMSTKAGNGSEGTQGGNVTTYFIRKHFALSIKSVSKKSFRPLKAQNICTAKESTQTGKCGNQLVGTGIGPWELFWGMHRQAHRSHNNKIAILNLTRIEVCSIYWSLLFPAFGMNSLRNVPLLSVLQITVCCKRPPWMSRGSNWQTLTAAWSGVLTAVTMRDVTSYGLVGRYKNFRRICFHHLQIRRRFWSADWVSSRCWSTAKEKLSFCSIKRYAMKTYTGVEV